MLPGDSPSGDWGMKERAAKPGGRPSIQPQSRSRPKPDRAPSGQNDKPFEPKQVRVPQRSTVMRLAAEVDALSAQLQASRARISELEARVDIDPLTDVLNRRGFERELKRSLAYVKRYGASVALVYLDLDDFKPVNDRHGHAAGDAVLKEVAKALTRHVRASDTVARLGGDEFAVLLWNLGAPDAVAKAAMLEAAVYEIPLRFGESSLAVGASAGLALLGALDEPAEVLARADAAMYARKAERNTSVRSSAALTQ
jgi:diguanylate cyclase (GGDEF)-like protein